MLVAEQKSLNRINTVYVSFKNILVTSFCILSLIRGVTIDGVWIGEWIYWPLTPNRLRTTSNYTANLHNSQITAAPAILFKPAVSLPTVPWQRLRTVEIFQLSALRSSFTDLHTEPPTSYPLWNSTDSLHFGTNHMENAISIVIAQQYLDFWLRIRCRGNVLSSRCLETALLYLSILESLHSNSYPPYNN
jgi:hypothetical protein